MKLKYINGKLLYLFEKKQGSTEWHQWRHDGMGSSDVSAILGFNKYKSRKKLLMEKIELDPPSDKYTYITDMGHRAEADIRKLFSLNTGVEYKSVCVQDAVIPFVRCSYDGLSDCGKILECKFVGEKKYCDIVKRGSVDQYGDFYYQVQYQMFVANATYATFGIVPFNPKGRKYDMDRVFFVTENYNQENMKDCFHLLVKFWEKVMWERNKRYGT